MNVYDFDGTILKGDTEDYFLAFFAKKYPFWAMIHGPKILLYEFLKKKKLMSYETVYDYVYREVLKRCDNLDLLLEEFWDKFECKVKKWYKDYQKEDDLIISGTPGFLLIPILKRLNIKNMIATNIDVNKKGLVGLTNFNEQKAINFLKKHNKVDIDNFYSDSYIDTPLALLAKNAYMVKDESIEKWKFNKLSD